MLIRKATQKDVKTLNHMLTLLIQDECQYDENINKNFVVECMYENYIEDYTKCILVAEEESIVGYLYGYVNSNDGTEEKTTAYLDALYIDPTYRKKRIASSLINEFKKWAIEEKGVQYIEVMVCSKNHLGKSLYEHHNFKPLRETLRFKKN